MGVQQQKKKKKYKTRKWNRDVRSLSGVVFEAIFEDSLKSLDDRVVDWSIGWGEVTEMGGGGERS